MSLPERKKIRLKDYVSKQWGSPIWQRSCFDRIIRDEQDDPAIWKYMDENPVKWQEDELFMQE